MNSRLPYIKCHSVAEKEKTLRLLFAEGFGHCCHPNIDALIKASEEQSSIIGPTNDGCINFYFLNNDKLAKSSGHTLVNSPEHLMSYITKTKLISGLIQLDDYFGVARERNDNEEEAHILI